MQPAMKIDEKRCRVTPSRRTSAIRGKSAVPGAKLHKGMHDQPLSYGS
jgi:hypothetical protein